MHLSLHNSSRNRSFDRSFVYSIQLIIQYRYINRQPGVERIVKINTLLLKHRVDCG